MPSYTVRFWALDEEEAPIDAAAELEDELEHEDCSGLSPTGDTFVRPRLEKAGFIGWLTFGELRAAKLNEVPAGEGVYVVWRAAADQPKFLDANPGGRFKGRDPTVREDALQANWVDGAEVVYIGKANALKRRLGEFERFGAGAPIGHWGGRLIWQLADSVKLRVAWKPTSGLDPKHVEGKLISEFREIYGKPPFANDPHLLGR